MANNGAKTLEDVLGSVTDLVDHFYNDTLAPHVKAKSGLTPVPLEQSTWVEEQRAWRNTAVLFDQSHHMPELFVRGRDAIKLLSHLGVNSFANFKPGIAKQYICCNPEGKVIGETLMYCHSDSDFELVSGMPLINWVEYNAQLGNYDVTLERDNNTARNPKGKRLKFRFGMDGPHAARIFEEAIEGPMPEIRFFGTATVRIAGCEVMALRHGMAGHMGVELSGDYDDGETVRNHILSIGQRHGIKAGGTLAYFSAVTEGGWMASPFPAIFTSPALAQYRKWLPATTWEAGAQLGGSYVARNIEDYYVTPWDLGVDARIKFDHDFVGRQALEREATSPTRCRRTLVWNKDDVARIFSSILEPGLACKMLRLPYASYAYQMYDAVRTADGSLAGLSTFVGYSANEAQVVSLAMMDREHAEIGTELVLTWGEPDGGSRKPHVERHRQTDVRVTVAPAPYASAVHKLKHGVVG
ncbi:MAG: aminomethyl transferase family protein [Gammaproteobacteria bacterium]|nr:aminomethyl transferase family protein [Gammaproteobacteria bacterium]